MQNRLAEKKIKKEKKKITEEFLKGRQMQVHFEKKESQ